MLYLVLKTFIRLLNVYKRLVCLLGVIFPFWSKLRLKFYVNARHLSKNESLERIQNFEKVKMEVTWFGEFSPPIEKFGRYLFLGLEYKL